MNLLSPPPHSARCAAAPPPGPPAPPRPLPKLPATIFRPPVSQRKVSQPRPGNACRCRPASSRSEPGCQRRGGRTFVLGFLPPPLPPQAPPAPPPPQTPPPQPPEKDPRCFLPRPPFGIRVRGESRWSQARL